MADGYGIGQVILIFGVPLLFAVGCGALMYCRYRRRKAEQFGMPSRIHHAEVLFHREPGSGSTSVLMNNGCMFCLLVFGARVSSICPAISESVDFIVSPQSRSKNKPNSTGLVATI